MKILGIIAEYNPFHNGHAFHIREALKTSNCDTAVVVMSGDFVQRGEPAIFPKHLRAKMALLEGASVILELPVCFATGSAEYFAHGAVNLLHSLGCIDALCFGSESGNLNELKTIAKILHEEPESYKEQLQSYLRQGMSYPMARQQAFAAYTQNENLSKVLTEPNNILGIEYLKALYALHSDITPFTIKRKGAGYHETDLHEQYSSASAIRKCFAQNIINNISAQVPSSAYTLIQDYCTEKGPFTCDDFSLLLKYRLLSETQESLCTYADISEDLAHRIINLRNQFLGWSQFCELLKTKELTFSRISRALMHIVLDIKQTDLSSCKTNGYCHYARVLGFRRSDSPVLKEFKEHSRIPVITKIGNCDSLSETGELMLKKDCYAANLYETVVTDKFRTPFVEEHSQSLCILS